MKIRFVIVIALALAASAFAQTVDIDRWEKNVSENPGRRSLAFRSPQSLFSRRRHVQALKQYPPSLAPIPPQRRGRRRTPIASARGYMVETDYRDDKGWGIDRNGPTMTTRTGDPVHAFKFVGAQPGRWRVRALDAAGNPGPKKEWREFSYTR